MNAKVFIFSGAAFIIGVASGIVSTKAHFKKKFEKKADDEIEQIKEFYKTLDVASQDLGTNFIEDEPTEPTPKEEKSEYAKLVEEIFPPVLEFPHEKEEPQVISVNEFEVYADYDSESLTYYVKDDILEDSQGFRIYDPESTVGHEALKLFKTPDDDGRLPDTVYVINDTRCCYYDISRCDEPYDGPEKEE